MTSIIRKTLLAGVALLAITGRAQASPTTMLEASVPFAFTVNGQTMPAGKYTVERDGSASVLVLRGEQGDHAVAVVPTIPNGGHDPAGDQPALTFKHREDQYQLSGIWQSDHDGWDVLSR